MCFTETELDVRRRDSFVAGYMHHVCGHTDDMERYMFGSRQAYDAWHQGYMAGGSHEPPAVWTEDAVEAAITQSHRYVANLRHPNYASA